MEQFVELRRELAASSTNSHNGEDVPLGHDLPFGTEEITDPAKVLTGTRNHFAAQEEAGLVSTLILHRPH